MGFQCEDELRQVTAQDLGFGVGGEGVEACFGVKTICMAWSVTTSTARALICAGAGDGYREQRVEVEGGTEDAALVFA